MINITEKHNCCGCTACVQRCPKQCISMIEDEEGFLYPHINKDICIDCGICERVCPIINQKKEKHPIKVFACKNKDEKVRMNSSSGGLFTAIAEEIIKKGGVVFGAKFDSKWNIRIAYTETLDGLKEFQGSKYTQAFVDNSYKDAETFLKKGRLVLFSGTSCQIAGLHNYLHCNYDNLLTIDFICHGVPSQKLFRIFLNEELSKLNSSRIANNKKISFPKGSNYEGIIKEIKFREKSLGWKKFSFSLMLTPTCENQKINSFSSRFSQTSYGSLFLHDLILRPSCYKCPSKSGKSNSNITVADFWGVNKFYPDFDDDKGITLTIINNEKGIDLIPFENIEYIEPTFDQAFANNIGYFKSTSLTNRRIEFWDLFNKGYSLTKINKIMYPISMKTKIKSIIKKILGLYE